MQLSQKRKTFSKFLFAFSEFIFNIEDFQKNDDTHSSCSFELTDSERRG